MICAAPWAPTFTVLTRSRSPKRPVTMPKRSVTMRRNARSSSAEMCGHDPEIGGHDGPKYALEELLSLFESRYYGQIHRHHETLSGRDILRHSTDQDHDHNDPPF